MDQSERTVATADGLQVYVREWAPANAKGSVVLVHGLGDHIQRYPHVAQALTNAGYAMVGFDLPGHGKSGGTRGHVASFQVVMDLITQILAETKEKYAGLPQFLYGHSLGASLSLKSAMTQRPSLDGMIATSPGLSTAEPVPGWKMALGKMLYNMAPTVQMENGLYLDGLSRNARPSLLLTSRTPWSIPKFQCGSGWILSKMGNGSPSIPKHSRPSPCCSCRGTRTRWSTRP